MKFYLALIIVVLTGCSSFNAPQLVQIPVPVKSLAPKISPQPSLTIYNLTSTSPPGDVMKSCLADIVALKGWGESLTLLLQAY